jgi:multidrug resistance efflux pump
MKFNILYLLFPAALGACIWIAWNFQGQSAQSFFGIAGTEAHTLNLDQDVTAHKRLVNVGDMVKGGDTLAIFTRTDLDKSESDQKADIRYTQSELVAEKAVLTREKELVNAKLKVESREILAEILALKAEDSLQTVFRENIYQGLKVAENQVHAAKIAALQNEIAALEEQANREMRLIDAKLNALHAIATAKTGLSEAEIEFIRSEKNRLVLLSPIDGYVEEVAFGDNSRIPAHADLIKINPLSPNRITGFIHESAQVPLSLGQEVLLSTHARPGITAKGTVASINPEMTELPLRLRKFIEIRSWGREVFIHIEGENQFFIAEKIIITLPEK